MASPARPFTSLVVVGASAGGIDALLRFVSALPPAFPAPIVIGQHLSPSRDSSLVEILARRSPLPVETVAENQRLQPGVIYVVPPNRDAVITDHEVLVRHEEGAGPRPSIDLLFQSAAEVFREDLIAVVLSGSGADGAVGARAVKRAGGFVIIQSPETAAFPGMPLALAPTIVDVASDPEQIGPLLQDLLTGGFVVPRPTEDQRLGQLLEQLAQESGIDFTMYKQPTIMRRLQRRMMATRQNSFADYADFVRHYPDERRRLVTSFLIKVTEFFRDPELYAYLREQVLPELIEAAHQRGGELRLWSAGCATGEEAYSLAMLVDQLVAETRPELGVRLFATDVDPEAVAFARHGIYPGASLASVPADLVERYFTPINGEYEAKKSLRSLVIFGDHDLGRRGPFPRIDLILCRNVLIYFSAALQRRALQLFAFSLRPGGYLVLGKSESVGPLPGHFAVDESHLKVYRRAGERTVIVPSHVHEARSSSPPKPPARAGAHLDFQQQSRSAMRQAARADTAAVAEDMLLRLPLGVVVVDANYDVQLINAAARRNLGIHSRAVDRDLLHLINDFPTADLRSAIDAALAGRAPSSLVMISTEKEIEARRALEIQCIPLPPQVEQDQRIIISVSDVTAREEMRRALAAAEARVRRLTETTDEVLKANVELTSTITTLRSENEELLIGSEEVQAATEEVETLNEELQASNEELETLNEELQATVEELNTTNDDLQARTLELEELAVASETARLRLETLLRSIGDAVMVVDAQGQIMMTNPAYDRMFGGPAAPLVPVNESGRPLPESQHPQRRAARGEAFSCSFVVSAPDGTRRWYEAQGEPLPSEDGSLRGVVTIRDITDRSLRLLQDQWFAIAGHELRTPLTALQAAAQLALRALPHEASAARSERHLKQVLTQARRLSVLTDQLIEATRIEQGQLVIDRDKIDLTAVLANAVETARLLTRGQEIVLESAADPVPVIGDRLRLEQVFLNLLSNAISYAPDTDRIDVRLQTENEHVIVAVRDYGPGIPPEDLETIFERHQRGHHPGRGKRGLGLGLFIARELTSAHGGTIQAVSTLGEGTTFTVSVPRAAAEPEPEPGRSSSQGG